MKKLASLSFLFLFCFCANQAFGQTPTPTPQPTVKPANEEDVVRITTNLIQVDVVVTDKKGKLIPNLKPEDFEILENDKRQNITTFSYISIEQPTPTDAPKTIADKNAPPVPAKLNAEQVRRTIALVVDDLGLSFESIYYVRRALKKFVDEQMQPGDLVAIVRTSSGVGALQQFTSDKQQLYAAIERVKYNSIGRGNIGAFAPAEDLGEDFDTSGIDNLNEFRDQVFSVGTLGAINYVVNGMRELPGRKAVMLFSDGFVIFNRDDPSKTQRVLDQLRRLTDLANRAGVVIYTMDARGLVYTGPTAADNVRPSQIGSLISSRQRILFDTQEGLIYLAKETGGFSIRNTNDLADGVRRVMDDQKSFYLIGYQPDEATFDPKRSRFNKLTVKVKLKDASVRYRSGFFGVKDEEIKPVEQTPQKKVITALMSPFSSGAVNVRLTTLFGNSQQTGSYIRSLLHINGREITFNKEADGFYKAEFVVLAVTFGDNGVPVDQVSKLFTLRVNEKWYQWLLQNGFVYYLNLPIKKAGAYQMRVALLDTPSSNVGSATQFIQVPDMKKERLTLSGIVLTKYEQDAKQATVDGVNNDGGVVGEADPLTQAARRQFHVGETLVFGYAIYNAKTDKRTNQPQLKTQVRLFRDGKQIFAGEESVFNPKEQADMQRLSFAGALSLGSQLQPGEYVLQVVVTDELAKEKYRTTSRWIEFELIK